MGRLAREGRRGDNGELRDGEARRGPGAARGVSREDAGEADGAAGDAGVEVVDGARPEAVEVRAWRGRRAPRGLVVLEVAVGVAEGRVGVEGGVEGEEDVADDARDDARRRGAPGAVEASQEKLWFGPLLSKQ